MQYPLYDYYAGTSFSTQEIFEHYKTTFYCRKYGRDKADKVCDKAAKIKGMKELFEQSQRENFIPSRTDLGTLLNGNMWFVFKSNRTQALVMLFLLTAWKNTVGLLHPIFDDWDVRNKALEVIKGSQLYEEMTKEEFEKMSGITL